jgi:glutamine synthetase type III
MAEKKIELDILLNIKPDDINSVKELKTTLRDLRSAALSVEEGSEAFNKITAKAGQLNDKIKDLNDVIGAQTGSR